MIHFSQEKHIEPQLIDEQMKTADFFFPKESVNIQYNEEIQFQNTQTDSLHQQVPYQNDCQSNQYLDQLQHNQGSQTQNSNFKKKIFQLGQKKLPNVYQYSQNNIKPIQNLNTQPQESNPRQDSQKSSQQSSRNQQNQQKYNRHQAILNKNSCSRLKIASAGDHIEQPRQTISPFGNIQRQYSDNSQTQRGIIEENKYGATFNAKYLKTDEFYLKTEPNCETSTTQTQKNYFPFSAQESVQKKERSLQRNETQFSPKIKVQTKFQLVEIPISQQYNTFEHSHLNQQKNLQQQVLTNRLLSGRKNSKQRILNNKENQNVINQDDQNTLNNNEDQNLYMTRDVQNTFQFDENNNSDGNQNTNRQKQYLQSLRNPSREEMKLPSINQNPNQNLYSKMSQQDSLLSQEGAIYFNTIKNKKQISQDNPKCIGKLAQMSLVKNDRIVKQISEELNSQPNSNKQIHIQSIKRPGSEEGNKLQATLAKPISSFNNTANEQQTQQNTSTQETTPEKSIKSSSLNSPVQQQNIVQNQQNIQFNQNSQPQKYGSHNNLNENKKQFISEIKQKQEYLTPSGRKFSSQNQRFALINSPKSATELQTQQSSSKNLYKNQIYYNNYPQKETLNQFTLQSQEDEKINQQNVTGKFSFNQVHQYNINILQCEDSDPNGFKQQDILNLKNNNNNQYFFNYKQPKLQTLDQQFLQKQQMLLQKIDSQQQIEYPLQQTNLMTFFDQQDQNKLNYNLALQQQHSYDSQMKKHQSLGQMSMSKRVQLDPIKFQDLSAQPYSSNALPSTKKFLTRKPQTKILSRVFSSKAESKPNKDINFTNVPQTAYSQRTDNETLFSDEQAVQNQPIQLNPQPKLSVNILRPLVNKNAKFFSSMERDQNKENKEQNNIGSDNNLNSFRNTQKKIGELDSLHNTLNSSNKVILQTQFSFLNLNTKPLPQGYTNYK